MRFEEPIVPLQPSLSENCNQNKSCPNVKRFATLKLGMLKFIFVKYDEQFFVCKADYPFYPRQCKLTFSMNKRYPQKCHYKPGQRILLGRKCVMNNLILTKVQTHVVPFFNCLFIIKTHPYLQVFLFKRAKVFLG